MQTSDLHELESRLTARTNFEAFFICHITNKVIDVTDHFNPKFCPYCGLYLSTVLEGDLNEG